jgi:CheY-like chemotaxis protein
MTKLMLIDDDQTMVRLLRTLLEMDGYNIVVPKAWDEIIDTIREEQPDLILIDYFLPHMEGLEVIKELRASKDLSKVRVVMTSGMDVTEQCREAGADAFLLKPYTPEVLLATIQENLGQDDIEDFTSIA